MERKLSKIPNTSYEHRVMQFSKTDVICNEVKYILFENAMQLYNQIFNNL